MFRFVLFILVLLLSLFNQVSVHGAHDSCTEPCETAAAGSTAHPTTGAALAVDSGCTVHMMRDMSLFSHMDPNATVRPVSVAATELTYPKSVGTI